MAKSPDPGGFQPIEVPVRDHTALPGFKPIEVDRTPRPAPKPASKTSTRPAPKPADTNDTAKQAEKEA